MIGENLLACFNLPSLISLKADKKCLSFQAKIGYSSRFHAGQSGGQRDVHVPLLQECE